MIEYVPFPVLPIVQNQLIINCVLVLLTVLVVGLRLVSRFLSGAGLWWDDYLILFAMPQGIGMLIIQGLWSPMGIGFPVTETLPNLETILKLLVAYELLYSTAISTIKLSVLFFYLRVFVNKSLRTATKATLVFVCTWSIGNILQVFLICRPFAKAYSLTAEGTCGNQVASFIAIGAFNIISDVLIIALPLPTVWSLKMSTATKLGLTGVFLVGLIVSVTAIIRIVTLTTLDLTNLTGTMIWADFWSTTEPNLGILCVSLPMLGSLWSRCAVRTRRGTSNYAYHSSDGNNTHGSANAFSKLRNPSSDADDGHHTTVALEDLYAANREVHYRSAVAAAATTPDLDRAAHMMHVDKDKDRDSGSEVALTEQEHDRDLRDANAIRVQTKWSISHN